MAAQERAGIAKLLEAEARAKEIIEAAKKGEEKRGVCVARGVDDVPCLAERTALQKQSKLEADQSIAEFKGESRKR